MGTPARRRRASTSLRDRDNTTLGKPETRLCAARPPRCGALHARRGPRGGGSIHADQTRVWQAEGVGWGPVAGDCARRWPAISDAACALRRSMVVARRCRWSSCRLRWGRWSRQLPLEGCPAWVGRPPPGRRNACPGRPPRSPLWSCLDAARSLPARRRLGSGLSRTQPRVVGLLTLRCWARVRTGH